MSRHDQIAAIARELWVRAGCPARRDQEIWLAAEREYEERRRRDTSPYWYPWGL